LALDEIKKQPYGKSRRVKRGLYKSITGQLINADVNGALNILRKVASDSPIQKIVSRGLVNRPKRLFLAFESNCKI
jgi:transposase